MGNRVISVLIAMICVGAPTRVAGQEVLREDIFLTPKGTSGFFGGYIGGSGNGVDGGEGIDWAIGNARVFGPVSTDLVISTSIGDFRQADNWRERVRIAKDGRVGIGLTNPPGERLHIGDGNVLLEGGGETALLVKRDFSVTGTSGTSTGPVFKVGRIIQAGDGDPEFRVLYADDTTPERSVFEFDRKGIVASVKPEVGSHFEGFVLNDSEPRFRLNSFPSMRLEMGPGGSAPPDVAVERAGAEVLGFRTGNSERMRVTSDGNVGIGTASPVDRLQVAGNVRAVNFVVANTDVNVPDYVFSPDYVLMSPEDLRAHIALKRRLPRMPGAGQIAVEGLNLGQFQMRLLEKIEELTLYVLQQHETLRDQQVRIEGLQQLVLRGLRQRQ